MRKAKQFHKPQARMTPEQIVQFLDDFAQIAHGKDKRTKLISLRVPENVLDAFKAKARLDEQKYQSIIVRLMRGWVEEK